jgi:hypothetical protein
MSINSYAYFEELYASIKPIRGRDTEVRPIGDRRRDWETIIRKLQADGTHSYIARLYNTDVVEYFANGDVVLRVGTWPTVSTAEFMATHSPFAAWKKHNKVWVRVRDNQGFAEGLAYPVMGDELRLIQTGEHKYAPAEPVLINKKVVDRARAKEARELLKPFMSWVKTFLMLSDGWVMHETCKQALGFGERGYTESMSMQYAYNMLTDPDPGMEPEGVYLKVLCCMALVHVARDESRVAEKTRWRAYVDVRIQYEDVRTVFHNWVRKHGDVHNIVQVKPDSVAIYNAA